MAPCLQFTLKKKHFAAQLRHRWKGICLITSQGGFSGQTFLSCLCISMPFVAVVFAS